MAPVYVARTSVGIPNRCASARKPSHSRTLSLQVVGVWSGLLGRWAIMRRDWSTVCPGMIFPASSLQGDPVTCLSENRSQILAHAFRWAIGLGWKHRRFGGSVLENSNPVPAHSPYPASASNTNLNPDQKSLPWSSYPSSHRCSTCLICFRNFISLSQSHNRVLQPTHQSYTHAQEIWQIMALTL